MCSARAKFQFSSRTSAGGMRKLHCGVVRIAILVFVLSQTCESFASEFVCEENGKKLNRYQICDGKRDCHFGSDETNDICQDPYKRMDFGTYCAYGAPVDQHCSKFETLCADGSDRSLKMCSSSQDEFNKAVRGNCSVGEMDCNIKKTQCVPLTKLCDGSIDCDNGRDESVDMCMESEDDCRDKFRCGNGVCIEWEKKCDNVIDCIDGSDEIRSVCGRRFPKQARCEEPIHRGVSFTPTTPVHSTNSTLFVYANQAARFECISARSTLRGSEWDVCLNTGKWRLNEASCNLDKVNNDPKTNGSEGCPINTYSEDLKILNCDSKQCQPMLPPINDVRVMFDCVAGKVFFPTEIKNISFGCFNKTWIGNKRVFEEPECLNTCDPMKLTCHDLISPTCTRSNSASSDCRSQILSGTVVDLNCKYGTMQVSRNRSQFECLEDGTWSQNIDPIELCRESCGQIEGDIFIPTTMNATAVSAKKSPWTVPLYRNRSTNYFQHSCNGVQLKAFIVITAAHCVHEGGRRIMQDDLKVGKPSDEISRELHAKTINSLLSVRKIVPHQSFDPNQIENDIALIILKAEISSDMPRIICLPWNYISEPYDTGEITGTLTAFSSSYPSDFKTLTMVYAVKSKTTVLERSFLVDIRHNAMICPGDSGSGFIVPCDPLGKRYCLYGILSAIKAFDLEKKCANSGKIAKLDQDFINKEIEKYSNNCEGID